MATTPETLALQAQLEAEVAAVTDAQTRTLISAWVLAWSEISADLQDTLLDLLAGGGNITRATMFRSVRLRQALDQITETLIDLAEQAGVTITADLDDVVDTAARAQSDILRTQLPDAPAVDDLMTAPWTRTDDQALAAIVQRTTEQIESATDRLAEDAADVVRRELIRGVAVGSSPRDTARRIVERAEKGFNGGLTRAMNIARTETLDAHRAAAEHGQNRHTDVLLGWTWLCDFSINTCPSCLARHGQVFGPEVPGPHDHQQGRCSRCPKTKSWADLGLEGLDEPEDALPDARAWFEELDEAEQLQIMGRARLQLLRGGLITFDDLTTLRTVDGWRDSWVVTPVAHLRALARRRRMSA